VFPNAECRYPLSNLLYWTSLAEGGQGCIISYVACVCLCFFFLYSINFAEEDLKTKISCLSERVVHRLSLKFSFIVKSFWTSGTPLCNEITVSRTNLEQYFLFQVLLSPNWTLWILSFLFGPILFTEQFSPFASKPNSAMMYNWSTTRHGLIKIRNPCLQNP
jgi:hypothetical protein